MNQAYRLGKDLRSFLRGFLSQSGPTSGRSVREPILKVQDIQGNILGGFNKDYQTLLFLEIRDLYLTKSWLRFIGFKIANLQEVLTFKKLYKAMKARRVFNRGALQSTWVNIAFSFQCLKKLTPSAELFRDTAFKEGMPARSLLLGDPTNEPSDGQCRNWVIGGPGKVPDILLIIASDSEDRLNSEIEAIKSQLGEALRIIHTENGRTPPEPLSAHEHFGFRDGISQPGVRGRVSDSPDDVLTQRENPSDANQGKPGQDLIWPGEFLFGYPGQSLKDKSSPGPIVEGGPSWAKNGSFLVFRRYRQNIEKFQNYLESTARQLAQKYPALAGLTAEMLGAKLIGRWKRGAPLLRAPRADVPAIADDSCADNHFEYVRPSQPIIGDGRHKCVDRIFPQSPGDDLGLICPHAAHIRKAFPRDDLRTKEREAFVQKHRLIRRGIPFGNSGSGECGLLFLSYQTSIEYQFEFIIRNWINNPDFRDQGAGYDPIVGQNNQSANQEKFFNIPVKGNDGKIENAIIELPTDWVIPTGGGYFFAPSISALKYLAE